MIEKTTIKNYETFPNFKPGAILSGQLKSNSKNVFYRIIKRTANVVHCIQVGSNFEDISSGKIDYFVIKDDLCKLKNVTLKIWNGNLK